jgi:hypothetical protein
MKIPSVQFNESNVGITPIQEGVRNRIGIVGDFSRGPANTPTFISGYTDFANRYGSDTRTGSLAYQAAFDQGASDFILYRVLGRAKSAKGTVRFSNTASKSNVLLFNLKFTGEVVDRNSVPLETLIVSSGRYTGSVSGRYLFKVTALSTSATVKYIFVPLGASEDIDWSTVTNTFTVVLASDKGAAKTVANGLSLTFGTVSQSNDVALRLNDEWSVRVNSNVFPININQGDLPNQVSTALIDALSGLEPLGEIVRTAEDDGVVFSLNSDLAGDIGNRYSYYFEFQDTVSPGITVTNNGSSSATSMQGGQDGPRNAVRDFYSLAGVPLLRLVAVSEGGWGNQLRVTIYPLSNSKFRLYIEDLNSSAYNPKLDSETYLLDFSDVDASGFINSLNTSKFVRGIFLPKFNSPTDFDIALIAQSPLRLAPPNTNITDTADIRHSSYFGPSKLVAVSFQNGFDGPALTDQDYISGLKDLESQPIHIVLTPGLYDSANIKAALIAHAEKSQEGEGLRIAILNARPNLNPNSAKQETVGFESKRAVMVAGWSTYAGQPNSTRFGLSPDAVYAGKLAATPYYAGPNARRTAGRVFNLTEVDTRLYSGTESLQVFTDARLEILAVDPALQANVFINGRTLSSDTAWEKVSIRRTYDVVRQDVNALLQQYKSEPHTELLRRQIASAINAYLQEKMRAGEIANFKSTQIDNSNNSPESYINGELNITIAFLPLYSADYINIAIVRDTQSGLVSFSGI